MKAPVKDILLEKVRKLAIEKGINVAWIDIAHVPDKDWFIAVISSMNTDDEIFKKNYEAPSVLKRMRDIETILLPSELFEWLPKSQSKVKARCLRIVGEVLAQEKAT